MFGLAIAWGKTRRWHEHHERWTRQWLFLQLSWSYQLIPERTDESMSIIGGRWGVGGILADVLKAKKRESKRRSGTEMALIPLNKADENSPDSPIHSTKVWLDWHQWHWTPTLITSHCVGVFVLMYNASLVKLFLVVTFRHQSIIEAVTFFKVITIKAVASQYSLQAWEVRRAGSWSKGAYG